MRWISLLVILLSLTQCDSTDNPVRYRGEFGDQYVFFEITGNSFTQGDSGSVHLTQYTYSPDVRELVLHIPVISLYDNFELIYGLGLHFQGSVTGGFDFAGSASSFPKTLNINDLLQEDLPFTLDMTFQEITDDGAVVFRLSGHDPETQMTSDTTVTLPADSSFQTQSTPPFPLEINGKEVTALARFRLANHGFHSKENIILQFDN